MVIHDLSFKGEIHGEGNVRSLQKFLECDDAFCFWQNKADRAMVIFFILNRGKCMFVCKNDRPFI